LTETASARLAADKSRAENRALTRATITTAAKKSVEFPENCRRRLTFARHHELYDPIEFHIAARANTLPKTAKRTKDFTRLGRSG